MEICNVQLFQAQDAQDSFALRLAEDPPEQWRAQTGFGKSFRKVWSIEFQSHSMPETRQVNWEAVLQRAHDAFNMSDPVITNFEWPQLETA